MVVPAAFLVFPHLGVPPIFGRPVVNLSKLSPAATPPATQQVHSVVVVVAVVVVAGAVVVVAGAVVVVAGAVVVVAGAVVVVAAAVVVVPAAVVVVAVGEYIHTPFGRQGLCAQDSVAEQGCPWVCLLQLAAVNWPHVGWPSSRKQQVLPVGLTA